MGVTLAIISIARPVLVVKGYVQNHPLIVIRVQKAVNVQYTIEAGVDWI